MLELFISFLISQKNYIPPTPQNYQINKIDNSQPYIKANSGLVVDINSNKILYKKNPTVKLPIASLTKLMTAYIILSENNLDQIVKIPQEAIQIGGSTIFLRTNEEITVENLLKGLLIQSGNDAAISLAIHNAQTVENFIQKMNTYAQTLHLKNTHFANPQGFDDPKNYSTSFDLYLLSKELLQFKEIYNIINQPELTIYSKNKELSHKLINTNTLLNNYLKINGLKTGTTKQALGCFIGITNDENPLLVITLGSTNRFLDAKTMLDWTKKKHSYYYLNQ